MEKWEYIKHTTPRKIAFTAIHTTGIFMTVTITSYFINQQAGMFDIEKNVDEKQMYIDRIVAIGVSVTKEEFFEVQEFYADNVTEFINGNIDRNKLRIFMNERNYIKEDVKDEWLDDQGRYMMDFEIE